MKDKKRKFRHFSRIQRAFMALGASIGCGNGCDARGAACVARGAARTGCFEYARASGVACERWRRVRNARVERCVKHVVAGVKSAQRTLKHNIKKWGEWGKLVQAESIAQCRIGGNWLFTRRGIRLGNSIASVRADLFGNGRGCVDVLA